MTAPAEQTSDSMPMLDDSLTATLIAIRSATKKFTFNHLEEQVGWDRRVRTIETLDKDTPAMLKQAWECAIHATKPDGIINTAQDYYLAAVDSYSDAILYNLDTTKVEEARLDRLVLRTLRLLNEMATWRMLAYQDLDDRWSIGRLQILDIWLKHKLNRPAASSHFVAHVRAAQAATTNSPINLTGQILHQSPEIACALVQSMLLETAGAETLTRVEIGELIKVIWLASGQIAFRIDAASTASMLWLHPVTGRTCRGNSFDRSPARYAGLVISAADIEHAVSVTRFRKAAWSNTLPADRMDLLIGNVLRNGWSVKKPERLRPRTKNSLNVRIEHGYGAVQKYPGNAIPRPGNNTNAQIADISNDGCSMTMPRWIAGPNFCPGRLVVIAGDGLDATQKFGTIAWMKQHDSNAMMLHFGVRFIKGKLSNAPMRNESGFPSGLSVEMLLVETMPGTEESAEPQKRIYLRRGIYTHQLRLQETVTGVVYTLGERLTAGEEFDIVQLQSLTGEPQKAKEPETEPPAYVPATREAISLPNDWSKKLQAAYVKNDLGKN